MGPVDGKPLSEAIPEWGLPLVRILELSIRLAESIHAVHERGIIHGNLEPDIVTLFGDDRVEILDGDDGSAAVVRYMSPERIRREAPDPRSDLFSLGIIVFRIATGRLPFSCATDADARASILEDAPLNVDDVRPELPRQLTRIVARCLEKDLRRRTRTALDLRDELEQLLRESVKVTSAATERQETPKVLTRDSRAYDLYLRGRKLYGRFGRHEMELALQLFARAIERDPEFAAAWTEIAFCRSFLFMYLEPSETHRAQAETASLKAIELDPDSARAQVSRGVAHSLNRREEDAERAFDTAIRLDPALFEIYYFYARHCFVNGKLEKAEKLCRQATKVLTSDPPVSPPAAREPRGFVAMMERLGRAASKGVSPRVE